MIYFISVIIFLFCLIFYLLFKLRSMKNYYKDKPSAWPQYSVSGDWREYKGEMNLPLYIKCLEREHALLSRILITKITYHCGHPFNERNLILRTVIRDLKLLYNHFYKTVKYKKIEDEAKYKHTLWQKL